MCVTSVWAVKSSCSFSLLSVIIVVVTKTSVSIYSSLYFDQILTHSLYLLFFSANEEYYQLLMINDSQPSGLDVSSYTIEEIDSITSEYTLKNNDIFAVAVSLITGRIVYISDQAASILNCKRDVFKNSKFVEFLTPQDVSVFYSFTTPYRLPSWSMCTGAESSPPDCMQEKSFFCRIRWVGVGSNTTSSHLLLVPVCCLYSYFHSSLDAFQLVCDIISA